MADSSAHVCGLTKRRHLPGGDGARLDAAAFTDCRLMRAQQRTRIGASAVSPRQAGFHPSRQPPQGGLIKRDFPRTIFTRLGEIKPCGNNRDLIPKKAQGRGIFERLRRLISGGASL